LTFEVTALNPPKHPQYYIHNRKLTSVEENLLAIGADVRRETGNDVFSTDPQLNEWMQRVKKLGSDGNDAGPDDDERARKFEEVQISIAEADGRRYSRRDGRDSRDVPVCHRDLIFSCA
jgi:hypothetical protein